MNGVSKAYSMTGWRIGYAGGPEPLIKAHRHAAIAVDVESLLDQPVGFGRSAGRSAGFPEELGRLLPGSSRSRRLDAQPGEGDQLPDAGREPSTSIRLCAGVVGRTSRDGKKIETDEDFATALLQEEGVAVVHGAAFGLSPFFRISYATGIEALEEACRRIQRFCANVT